MNTLTLAIPSKGRLMEQAAAVLEAAGLSIERSGTERGYRGQLKGIDGIEVAFLSAAEIAQNLREGKIDFGITGADLLWEKSAAAGKSCLGSGAARFRLCQCCRGRAGMLARCGLHGRSR